MNSDPVPMRGLETANDRAHRLQDDAQAAAMGLVDHVMGGAVNLVIEIESLSTLSLPPGLRDEMRRMGETLGRQVAVLQGLRGRS